ncbi:MAG: proline--tRNA ligase [Candidatus Handelsmanbacteria bacterium]|nr:proline--tRNA ligase [Candidatus Handelsmanbacteria bacterium]
MRTSRLFSQTLREAPADAEVESHRLLLRAGFIRQLASGIFSYLPLARRALDKIERIIREEMDAIGGQEITMPVVHPADIWKETGRWFQIGAEMGRFKDKNERDMVLAMTHEEVVGDLVRREIRSYRQLPQLVYQLQTKWRDDPRPRSGLIRVREFSMKDSYSLDADWEGLEAQYRAHYQAYFNIFHRCGLAAIAVKSDTGMMGGKVAHEYMYLNPIGEDTLILCDGCGYAANRQVARFAKPPAPAAAPLPLERVATPGTKTIEDLARLLGIGKSQTAKVVFLMARQADESEKLVMAIVRGDMEVNETKLGNAVKAKALRPAREEEIAPTGAVPGYASPIGVKGALVVVDEAVVASPNLVAGANEEGYHLKNVNCGRDYHAELVTDLAAAQEGDGCPECGAPLRASRGVEVGNIFQLGTRYTDAMHCTFLDAEGKARPLIMGSYGIGVGRLLACVAEEHRDEKGLVWPLSVAPYQVHLVSLAKGAGPSAEAAERLYRELQEVGLEVLLDDRGENPGVKFNDADLIGLPLRLIVGERSLKKGVVEMKLRGQQENREVPLAEVVAEVVAEVAGLREALRQRVVEVPFKG